MGSLCPHTYDPTLSLGLWVDIAFGVLPLRLGENRSGSVCASWGEVRCLACPSAGHSQPRSVLLPWALSLCPPPSLVKKVVCKWFCKPYGFVHIETPNGLGTAVTCGVIPLVLLNLWLCKQSCLASVWEGWVETECPYIWALLAQLVTMSQICSGDSCPPPLWLQLLCQGELALFSAEGSNQGALLLLIYAAERPDWLAQVC